MRACFVRDKRRRRAVPVFSDQFSRPSRVRARRRHINALTRFHCSRTSKVADAPLVRLSLQTGIPPCFLVFVCPRRALFIWGKHTDDPENLAPVS